MNIRQYYRQSAVMSLNASLISLVPIILIVIGFSLFPSGLLLILSSIPFFIYSFICFQNYQLQNKRFEETMDFGEMDDPAEVLDQSQWFIAFLPAPSLRMVLFEPKGRMVGEIKDIQFWKIRWFLPYWIDRFIPKKYGVYNHQQQFIGKILIKKRKIQLWKPQEEFSANLYCTDYNGKKESWSFEEKIFSTHKEWLLTDVRYQVEHLGEVARLKKGWMPKGCEKYFKDANTPIFSMQKELKKEDKLILLGLLVRFYCYREH
ncbi:hypothetical protein ACE38V_04995 [Cytobacillus sp. Hz8]|uniref:hypothetical protein n=1 Tax=Cytobacillus sp. Hz8 TaxID=3347168 RepID=UPI0035E2F4B9